MPHISIKQKETIRRTLDPNSPTYGNATASAKLVYKGKPQSCRIAGQRALKKLPQVAEELFPNIPISEIKTELTVEWVLDKLKLLAQNSKRASDKIRATELIGKYLQMFKDFSTTETRTVTAKSEDELDKEFREISGKYKDRAETLDTQGTQSKDNLT